MKIEVVKESCCGLCGRYRKVRSPDHSAGTWQLVGTSLPRALSYQQPRADLGESLAGQMLKDATRLTNV